MSDKNSQIDEKISVKEKLSPPSLERRRALFRGAGKGAAVLGAVVPLHTLAGETLLTFDGKHHCSISGMHSGVHSKTPTNSPVCGGYSPGWWGQVENGSNPPAPRRTWPALPGGLTYNSPAIDTFSKHTLANNPTLFQVMASSLPGTNYSSTDEFHWICAWLNALSNSFNFPYTGDQVLGFYRSAIPGVYDDALKFFSDYMETHTP